MTLFLLPIIQYVCTTVLHRRTRVWAHAESSVEFVLQALKRIPEHTAVRYIRCTYTPQNKIRVKSIFVKNANQVRT